MKKFIIAILLIISAHILWHYFYIVANGGMGAGYKLFSNCITWFLIGLFGYLFLKLESVYLMPLVATVFWIIKDAALGWLLHRDLFYLGTGKWDQFWLVATHSGLNLFYFKLFVLLFFSGLCRYVQR